MAQDRSGHAGEMVARFQRHNGGRCTVQLTYKEHMREQARAYLVAVLAEAGSVSGAARLAGRNRTNMHRLLVKYGVATPNKVHRGNWGDDCARATN